MPGHDPSRRNRQDQDQDEQSFSLSLSLCCTSTHSDRIDMNPACKRPQWQALLLCFTIFLLFLLVCLSDFGVRTKTVGTISQASCLRSCFIRLDFPAHGGSSFFLSSEWVARRHSEGSFTLTNRLSTLNRQPCAWQIQPFCQWRQTGYDVDCFYGRSKWNTSQTIKGTFLWRLNFSCA